MIPALLATEPIHGHPGFLENLAYQTVGMMVVLTSLGTLMLCVGLLGKALGKPAAAVAAHACVPPAPPAASPPQPAGPSVSAEMRAVIAASVHATTGHHLHIHSIHPANPLVQAWSVEGRRQIFSSHNPR